MTAGNRFVNIRCVNGKGCRARFGTTTTFGLYNKEHTMNATMPMLPRESELPEDTIRRCAYFLWLDRGCPEGTDWEHWFEAKQLLSEAGAAGVKNSSRADDASPGFSIGNTVAARLSDPTHRFHAPGLSHDDRLTVVAGEARQRVRGRRSGGSLRAQPKKPN
jgi:hypothetical protein